VWTSPLTLVSPGVVIDCNIVWRLRFNWTCHVAVKLGLTVIMDDKWEGSGRRQVVPHWKELHNHSLSRFKEIQRPQDCSLLPTIFRVSSPKIDPYGVASQKRQYSHSQILHIASLCRNSYCYGSDSKWVLP
jgi:hypothetical protein